MFILALLTVTTARGEGLDTLQIYVQQGDSCMQQYNTFEALKHYQQAFDVASKQGIVRFSMNDDFSHSRPYVPEDVVPKTIRLKLSDCHYKRANYRQCAELLKNMSEDSLTHDAFRQLVYSYKHQGDNGAYMYWASQLLKRYPMDGEIVAGLALAYARDNQPQKGIVCAAMYTLKDSTNILVNRAEAEAWLLNGDYTMAAKLYNRLLQQGDSTFSTLYSAGMCYTKTDSLERAYQCLKPALWLSGMKHYGAAYRLGVVCVDTQRYDEGLGYLSLAMQLMQPDTTAMKAITLSQSEGYYLTQHYEEAVAAWKEHLTYNPASIATYYNIANTYAYLLKDKEQAKTYYQQFLTLARKEESPNAQLIEMIAKAEENLKSAKPNTR
jgi:tetratricopeptide (TPR) repeat protein